MWVIAAIRQILVNHATFTKLVDERMASGSVSMLRMQLDIGARTNALFLVEEPEEVARRVLQGEVLNMFRDRDGKRLLDGYLFDQLLLREEKWKQLLERFRYLGCAHIHFSAAAVQRSIQRISETEIEFRDVFEDDFANNKEREDTTLAMEVVTHAVGTVVLDVFNKF
jgi:hypothetical protein